MITLLVTIYIQGKDSRDFVRHYETCPWPRLPNKGETIDLGSAADIFTEVEVPVESVIFHPINGNVVIELVAEEILPGSLDCLYELEDIGFVETNDPFREYGSKSLTNSDDSLNDHQCKYRQALEEIDRLDPKNFQQGQEHLAPAFRAPNITAAFRQVIRIVNSVLHNTEEFRRPL